MPDEAQRETSEMKLRRYAYDVTALETELLEIQAHPQGEDFNFLINRVNEIKGKLNRMYQNLLGLANLDDLDRYTELLFGTYEEALAGLRAHGLDATETPSGPTGFLLLKKIRDIVGRDYIEPRKD